MHDAHRGFPPLFVSFLFCWPSENLELPGSTAASFVTRRRRAVLQAVAGRRRPRTQRPGSVLMVGRRVRALKRRRVGRGRRLVHRPAQVVHAAVVGRPVMSRGGVATSRLERVRRAVLRPPGREGGLARRHGGSLDDVRGGGRRARVVGRPLVSRGSGHEFGHGRPDGRGTPDGAGLLVERRRRGAGQRGGGDQRRGLVRGLSATRRSRARRRRGTLGLLGARLGGGRTVLLLLLLLAALGAPVLEPDLRTSTDRLYTLT